MSPKAARALVWMMLLIFSVRDQAAESQPAMVTASGVAAMNGVTLVRTANLFGGELLETRQGAALTVSKPGSSILIGPNSRARYFGDYLELQLGLTQINTSMRLRLQTDSVEVEPDGPAAKFRVERATHTVVIAALERAIRVNNNGETRVLSPGTTVRLVEKDQNDPASPVSGPSNGRIFIYAAGTLGGAALLIWKLDHKKPCVSNQIP